MIRICFVKLPMHMRGQRHHVCWATERVLAKREHQHDGGDEEDRGFAHLSARSGLGGWASTPDHPVNRARLQERRNNGRTVGPRNKPMGTIFVPRRKSGIRRRQRYTFMCNGPPIVCGCGAGVGVAWLVGCCVCSAIGLLFFCCARSVGQRDSATPTSLIGPSWRVFGKRRRWPLQRPGASRRRASRRLTVGTRLG